MSAPTQTIQTVDMNALLDAVRERQLEGCRLVQICCTRLVDRFEMTYSFAREGAFNHVRVQVPDASVVLPSISVLFACSFAYENEIHDLFGLSFRGLNVDYKGKFYKTAIPTPFGSAPVCGVPAKPVAKVTTDGANLQVPAATQPDTRHPTPDT